MRLNRSLVENSLSVLPDSATGGRQNSAGEIPADRTTPGEGTARFLKAGLRCEGWLVFLDCWQPSHWD